MNCTQRKTEMAWIYRSLLLESFWNAT